MPSAATFDRTRVIPFQAGSYARILELQHRLLAERIEGASPDVLLLGEHEPVITVGRGTRAPIGDVADVAGLAAPVVEVERGGQVTWHGPGQLVGYPILSLPALGLNVREYLRRLEEALILALEGFHLSAGRRDGATGVWVGERKVASIGVALRRFVTYHGFALNVDPDLQGFRGIEPCGFAPEVMTSLAALLPRPPALEEVTAAVLRELVRCLELAPPIWEPAAA